MARPKRPKPSAADIVGLKYFDRLLPLLERLHPVGTDRDKAGNRKLFFDNYCAYILLFLSTIACVSFFNFVVKPMREARA